MPVSFEEPPPDGSMDPSGPEMSGGRSGIKPNLKSRITAVLGNKNGLRHVKTRNEDPDKKAKDDSDEHANAQWNVALKHIEKKKTSVKNTSPDEVSTSSPAPAKRVQLHHVVTRDVRRRSGITPNLKERMAGWQDLKGRLKHVKTKDEGSVEQTTNNSLAWDVALHEIQANIHNNDPATNDPAWNLDLKHVSCC